MLLKLEVCVSQQPSNKLNMAIHILVLLKQTLVPLITSELLCLYRTVSVNIVREFISKSPCLYHAPFVHKYHVLLGCPDTILLWKNLQEKQQQCLGRQNSIKRKVILWPKCFKKERSLRLKSALFERKSTLHIYNLPYIICINFRS